MFLKEIVLAGLLLIIIVASLTDLMIDFSHQVSLLHLMGESLVILLSSGGILYLIREIWQRKQENQSLQTQLAVTRQDLSATQARLKAAGKQYSQLIQDQFAEWQLTTSEREVALLLLKGLSLKEIADLRNTLEKTVRQQASGIYKKSALNGRHEFAAYFFEDFLS